jgi:hypothetical protein
MAEHASRLEGQAQAEVDSHRWVAGAAAAKERRRGQREIQGAGAEQEYCEARQSRLPLLLLLMLLLLAQTLAHTPAPSLSEPAEERSLPSRSEPLPSEPSEPLWLPLPGDRSSPSSSPELSTTARLLAASQKLCAAHS